MIKILMKNHRYAPIFICDACNKRITDAKMAIAISPSGNVNEGDLNEVLHLHKGNCDKIGQQKLGGQNGWEPLEVHILFLWLNAGLSFDDVTDVKASLERLGEL
jgi:hypothetical protein